MIVGAGEHIYEVLRPFGKFPDEMKLGSVSHVSVDSNDRVYFYQRKNPPILVFDIEGNLIKSWGEDLLVDGHGVFITKNGDVFAVARGVHEVLKFNAEGELNLRIGNREKPSWQSPFNHPTDVAVSLSGEIYVKFYFAATSEMFGKAGLIIDRPLQEDDFFHPMDIFIDAKGIIYVTDQTPRFTVVNSEGELLSRGFAPDAGHGIWGDSQGNLYLAGLQSGVVKLTKQ